MVVGGGRELDYLILKNGESTIGIFHGMFEGNILTFNPGSSNRMERFEEYLDVRDVQDRLLHSGISPSVPIDPEAGNAGPASITLTDPDGNTILIDQFF